MGNSSERVRALLHRHCILRLLAGTSRCRSCLHPSLTVKPEKKLSRSSRGYVLLFCFPFDFSSILCKILCCFSLCVRVLIPFCLSYLKYQGINPKTPWKSLKSPLEFSDPDLLLGFGFFPYVGFLTVFLVAKMEKMELWFWVLMNYFCWCCFSAGHACLCFCCNEDFASSAYGSFRYADWNGILLVCTCCCCWRRIPNE